MHHVRRCSSLAWDQSCLLWLQKWSFWGLWVYHVCAWKWLRQLLQVWCGWNPSHCLTLLRFFADLRMYVDVVLCTCIMVSCAPSMHNVMHCRYTDRQPSQALSCTGGLLAAEAIELLRQFYAAGNPNGKLIPREHAVSYFCDCVEVDVTSLNILLEDMLRELHYISEWMPYSMICNIPLLLKAQTLCKYAAPKPHRSVDCQKTGSWSTSLHKRTRVLNYTNPEYDAASR